MTKLFASEDIDIETTSDEQLVEAKIENSDIPNVTEFHEDVIVVTTEALARASNELFLVGDMKSSLESKKLGSPEYFTSIDNYTLYMKNISNNLGVKAKLPSLEDFKNPYGTKASHEFVMEGFSEFVRNIWEKIKSFFKDFFKRIMLFLKRLVNANLEMEEYEQYIEDLMHRVKRSDKDKVTPIKADSKLPKFLSSHGDQEFNVDYLVSNGRHKLENLAKLINVLSDKAIPSLLSSLATSSKGIHDEFVKGYKPTPEVAAEFTSLIRGTYNNAIKGLFPYNTGLKAMPEDVYNSVLNAFDNDQLDKGNATFHSMCNDSDKSSAMPKNYNLYLTISDFGVPIGDREIRTSKINLSVSRQVNPVSPSEMFLISERTNLLKFYDFYKNYSKEVKLKTVEARIEKLHDYVADMIKKLEEPFGLALENNEVRSGITQVRSLDDGPSASYSSDFGFGGNYGGSQSVPNNGTDDAARIKTKEEIMEFQKFVFGYLNSLQVFIREYTVSILGTYQETRYELIKYLYKSAKQF